MPELTQSGAWLPLVFLGLMGIAMMAYVILDHPAAPCGRT
jgi:hypothetical protein